LREQARFLKIATRFVQRNERHKVVELEQQIQSLCETVDRFYALVGARHWIFTDNLPMDEIAAEVNTQASPEAAEAALVEVLARRIEGEFWRLGLMGHDALRARSRHLERAREHYINGKWDSCALLLVTVMDGFVNDVEPAERRGLHAREATEMVAWDKVAGHHLGLSAVMPIFLKTVKRRVDDEVFEVHRHGIVHGMLTNYDSQVVATKAWNLLAAVVDWAGAMAAMARPPEPKATWGEVWRGLVRHAEVKRDRESFTPSFVPASDHGFEALEVVRQARRFFESWEHGRWSHVAELMPGIVMRRGDTPGERAVMAKETYAHVPVSDVVLAAVEFPSAGVAVVTGTATIGEVMGPFTTRWLYEKGEGDIALPGDEGAHWALAVFPPNTFIDAPAE
jgi:hypothetical protein